MTYTNVILASNSPRRRELLRLTGCSFDIRPTHIDETPLDGELPAAYVLRLAVGKARVAAQDAPGGYLVVGADTTVADGDEIMGKPASDAEARAMLRQLRDRTHMVFTAVAIVDPTSGRMASEVCATQVPMRDYSDDEIDDYVASGDPLDKAGAYAIQHPVFKPVPALKGCRASVMGLPLCHLARAMRSLGSVVNEDLAARCQALLDYDCPIHAAVLRGEQVG